MCYVSRHGVLFVLDPSKTLTDCWLGDAPAARSTRGLERPRATAPGSRLRLLPTTALNTSSQFGPRQLTTNESLSGRGGLAAAAAAAAAYPA